MGKMFTRVDRAYIKMRFDRIETMLKALLEGGELTMATLDDVKAKVDAQDTVIDSATALLDGITQQLKDLQAQLSASGQDTAKIDEIIAGLDNNTGALAAAVARNTSAEDEIHAAGM